MEAGSEASVLTIGAIQEQDASRADAPQPFESPLPSAGCLGSKSDGWLAEQPRSPNGSLRCAATLR